MKITERKHYYYGWYDVTIPPGKPSFAFGTVFQPELQTEIKDWLVEHVGQSGRHSWVQGGIDKYGRHLLFKDSDDAMMFKLTWV